MKRKVRKNCQRCGRLFKASIRAKWCSNACKQAAYRLRIMHRNKES